MKKNVTPLKLGQPVWWVMDELDAFEGLCLVKDRIRAIVIRQRGTFYMLDPNEGSGEWRRADLFATKAEGESALAKFRTRIGK